MKTIQSSLTAQRKLYLILAVFAMIVFTHDKAICQDASSGVSGDSGGSSSSGFIWGGKAGPTFNQFNHPGTFVGLTAGLVGSFEVTDYFTTQIELLYAITGGGRADADRNFVGIGNGIATVHYQNRAVVMQNIELPLMLFFTLSELNSGDVVPRLGIGASYAYCVAAFENHDKIYTLDNGVQTILGSRTENIGADIEPHQFSLNVGLAVDYKLTGGKILGTEMRYKYGLNDVNLYKSTYTGSVEIPTSLSFALTLKF